MKRELERLVWRRAGGRCEYRQISQNDLRLPFAVDHIIALKHRGATRASNLCLSCAACNSHQGPNISGIDEVTKRLTPLFNPRRHKWSKHFRWDGPTLVGLTPIGRATVTVLEINLDYRVEFRRDLIEEGVFPPERATPEF